MPATTFPEFEAAAKARGFDEVLARRWDADVVIDTHRHAFAVEALVVDGEMWLTVGDETPGTCGAATPSRSNATFPTPSAMALPALRTGSPGATPRA